MSKLVPCLDDHGLALLKPVFISRCYRWTSRSSAVSRIALVSQDGMLYLMNEKFNVTHSLSLRGPEVAMALFVEFESSPSPSSGKQAVAVGMIKKATVLDSSSFSLAERLGVETDDGMILSFVADKTRQTTVAEFVKVATGFKSAFDERLKKAQTTLLGELVTTNSCKSDDYVLRQVGAGEVIARAQLARTRSGILRHDDPSLAKAGELQHLIHGPAAPKDGVMNITDVVKAISQSPLGSPVRLDRPVGLRHLPHRIIPKEVLLQRPPIPGDQLESIRRQLVDVYTKHVPAKVKDVDQLLNKYKGLEDLLLIKVMCKYRDAPIATPAGETKLSRVIASSLPPELSRMSDCQKECETMRDEIKELEERCEMLQHALRAQNEAAAGTYERTRIVRRNLCRVVADVCVAQQKRQWRLQEQALELELEEIQHELKIFSKLL